MFGGKEQHGVILPLEYTPSFWGGLETSRVLLLEITVLNQLFSCPTGKKNHLFSISSWVEQLSNSILQIEGAVELRCLSYHLVHVVTAALLLRNQSCSFAGEQVFTDSVFTNKCNKTSQQHLPQALLALVRPCHFLCPLCHHVLMNFRAMHEEGWLTPFRCVLPPALPCVSSAVLSLERSCFCFWCTCCWALMSEKASSGGQLVLLVEGVRVCDCCYVLWELAVRIIRHSIM